MYYYPEYSTILFAEQTLCEVMSYKQKRVSQHHRSHSVAFGESHPHHQSPTKTQRHPNDSYATNMGTNTSKSLRQVNLLLFVRIDSDLDYFQHT
jgi:hypothetical protein